MQQTIAQYAVPLELTQQISRQMEVLRQGWIQPAIKVAAAVDEAMRESLPDNWRGLSASQLTTVLRLAVDRRHRHCVGAAHGDDGHAGRRADPRGALRAFDLAAR